MGRGKIEIKLIENPTNRQVTYSKRRNGIFKKAHELSVLCDAKVSLIMFSKNNKMHEYISPGLSTKKIIDQYQKTLGDIDLWHSHYEKMLENLKKLKDINNKLRRQIRNRIGEGSLDMDDMSFQQLRTLEEDMVSAIAKIRERKFHVIRTRTETCRKKVRSLEQMNGNLLLELEKCVIHPQFILHDEGEQESAVALANGASNLYAFCHHHTHLNHHLHNHHAPPEPFKNDDLRLA
ncbi:agamous-like MADS-box protein TM6 isoform X2 [Arachis duranensis]|uniref:Agamous-like MADS-box protein TM6 isoform X2 n=1 Tax=Arachis duranensis TaxID=130453 RepID=A0A6P4D8W2_ARADU|nr:agamous-like MADS-box protein TM6 isoform X2 [Arachis duranensis]XP_016200659.1 floral homeotic protein PMADS 1 isoform X2 [Arachis ipaensis]XP_025653544.1 floral homeotic protein PMADS 1 isoform X2 [Arachis hypogaea]XP_025698951.1 floral homeotic protein PMADS 1 isoform X2 [Arachis hypogaea]XP_057762444.1 agamous-like MADS-box protein TM6 isoform X2 [Arachis stenosperma]QHO10787.1 Floral homeotic protein DEFICIENS [Arachis hypogaea]QHO40983.1 Floral homeotic protein DEFICIENS [Arachis hyp